MSEHQPLTLQPTSEQSPLSLSHLLLALVLCSILLVLYFRKSSTRNKSILALIGQRSSGKTQLFISLNQGKSLPTVPSIHNNCTSYRLNARQYTMIDYIGDAISKQQVLNRMSQLHTIVHVVDGTNAQTYSDAAMFMYRVLVSKQYQKFTPNYVIFVNKGDVTGCDSQARVRQVLEDEIEHIRQGRINQGEENEGQDDYIKLSKTRFKVEFPIVVGSARGGIKGLQALLEGL